MGVRELVSLWESRGRKNASSPAVDPLAADAGLTDPLMTPALSDSLSASSSAGAVVPPDASYTSDPASYLAAPESYTSDPASYFAPGSYACVPGPTTEPEPLSADEQAQQDSDNELSRRLRLVEQEKERRSRQPSGVTFEDGKAKSYMGSAYHGEQHYAGFRSGGVGAEDRRSPNSATRAIVAATTQYWDDDKRAQHKVGVEDGKLNVGEERMNTLDATGIGTLGAMSDGKVVGFMGERKHIFTMQDDGTITAADPHAEKRESKWGGQQMRTRTDASGEDVTSLLDSYSVDYVNHSSLVAGGAVTGAGELQVQDGVLQQISNASGHYQPNDEMMAQVVSQFQDDGVDMHDVGLKLHEGADNRFLHASAREFQNYGGSELATSKMLERRSVFKEQLLEEIEHRETYRRRGIAPPRRQAFERTKAAESDTSWSQGAEGQSWVQSAYDSFESPQEASVEAEGSPYVLRNELIYDGIYNAGASPQVSMSDLFYNVASPSRSTNPLFYDDDSSDDASPYGASNELIYDDSSDDAWDYGANHAFYPEDVDAP